MEALSYESSADKACLCYQVCLTGNTRISLIQMYALEDNQFNKRIWPLKSMYEKPISLSIRNSLFD